MKRTSDTIIFSQGRVYKIELTAKHHLSARLVQKIAILAL